MEDLRLNYLETNSISTDTLSVKRLQLKDQCITADVGLANSTVKRLYEENSNTNEFTDDEKRKLRTLNIEKESGTFVHDLGNDVKGTLEFDKNLNKLLFNLNINGTQKKYYLEEHVPTVKVQLSQKDADVSVNLSIN